MSVSFCYSLDCFLFTSSSAAHTAACAVTIAGVVPDSISAHKSGSYNKLHFVSWHLLLLDPGAWKAFPVLSWSPRSLEHLESGLCFLLWPLWPGATPLQPLPTFRRCHHLGLLGGSPQPVPPPTPHRGTFSTRVTASSSLQPRHLCHIYLLVNQFSLYTWAPLGQKSYLFQHFIV